MFKLAVVLGVSALPWGEVVVAIPVGIGLGLPAGVTFMTAVVGNVCSVVFLLRMLLRWERARGLLLRGMRARRAEALMNRYGVVGLSAQAPIISGAHAAALVGVLLGVRFWPLTIWLTISITAWAGVVVVLASLGKQLVLGLL